MSVADEQADYGRIARDGAFNLAGQLAALLAGLAIIPFLLHELGAQAYGVLLLAMTGAAFAGYLDLGIGSAIGREAAADAPDRNRFLAGAGAVLALFGAAVAVAMAGVGVIAYELGLAPGLDATPLVFALIGVAFWGDQLALYHVTVLSGRRMFGTVNALTAGSLCVRAAVTAGLLAAGAGVAVVAGWYALSAWLWAAFSWALTNRLSPGDALRLVRPEAAALRPRMRFGVGSLAVMLAAGAMTNAVPVVVAAIDGAAASALFQVSQRFGQALQTVPDRVAVTLFPAAAAGGSMVQLVTGGMRLSSLILVPPAAVLLAAPDDVLRAWLGSVPPHGAAVLRLMVIATIVQTPAASAMQVLWGQGRLRGLVVAVAAGAVSTIVLAVALTLAMGLPGAALGLALGAAVFAVGVLAVAVREEEFSLTPVLKESVRALGGPALLCATVTVGVSWVEPASGWVRVGILVLASGTAYLLGLVAVRHRLPEADLARAVLRRVPGAQRAAYLTLGVYSSARDTRRRNRATSLTAYEKTEDPWGYGTDWGPEHLERTERLLDVATAERPPGRTLDLGCGEGWVTERLAERCPAVLAVDISPTALARARERVGARGNVEFREWDLLDGPAIGRFDLVVAMSVLELFGRPRAMRRARGRVLELLAPDAHLLVATTKQSPVIEAETGSLLVRGGRPIDRFVRSGGQLELTASEESETHLFTLYRYRGPDGDA